MELLVEALDGPVGPAWALLAADERSRAERLRDPLLRDRFVLARAFVRRALGLRLRRDPAGLVFHHGPYGKPLVDGIYFNVSHAADRAALALSMRHPVGVDIELQRPIEALEIARQHFSVDETRELAALGDPVPAFFRLWTCKEAILKAHGLGITHSLAHLPRAQIREFTPGPGFCGAVAWLQPMARRQHPGPRKIIRARALPGIFPQLQGRCLQIALLVPNW